MWSLYAGRINRKLLSCCDACHKAMIEFLRDTITDETDTSYLDTCPHGKCLGWNYDSKCRVMQRYDRDTTNFPTVSSKTAPVCPEFRLPGISNIQPQKQDFDWLLSWHSVCIPHDVKRSLDQETSAEVFGYNGSFQITSEPHC